MKEILVGILLILVITPMVNASHIIGGDISYQLLSHNPTDNTSLYRFTMKMYVDCGSSAMDDFDEMAAITIFKRVGSGTEKVINNEVPLSDPKEVTSELSDPCLVVPQTICVKEGAYVFEVELPVIDETYHVSYQRCCRNGTINNIVEPDRVGSTYTIDLFPAAQVLKNSSPTFNQFPPIYICVNEPIDFDHSASDVDGDQLDYELCSPILGAGTVGFFTAGDNSSCEGFRPNPACPPPYDNISYISPQYNATMPMGINANVAINPSSGLLTGVPDLQGQFIIANCIREYRNGELLSITRRDFQFNVVTCEPAVYAQIEFDEQFGDQQFIVNSCGSKEVSILNESTYEEYIDEYQWSFDINGTPQNFNTKDVTIVFPDTGVYNGTLILNPEMECIDTAEFIVNVYPAIHADFSFDYDSCLAEPEPIVFTDQSYSEGGSLSIWAWDVGDGNGYYDQDLEYLFDEPGIHNVRLVVGDGNGCYDETNQLFKWFPVPSFVLIEPSHLEGCEPLSVNFDNLSSPIDENYDIVWDFGDGDTSSAISPTHIYQRPGLYTISLDISSPIGCKIDTTFYDWIDVNAKPIANFAYSPNELNNFNSTVTFEDLSEGASHWEWDFDATASSNEVNPIYNFPDTGEQVVNLIVTHIQGCQDTATRILDVVPQVKYFLPNAFTPNFDAINDEFVGKGYLTGLYNFHLTISNRWGEIIFETNDPTEGWNGRKNNTGRSAPHGVYPYVITYDGPRGQAVVIKGFASLIR